MLHFVMRLDIIYGVIYFFVFNSIGIILCIIIEKIFLFPFLREYVIYLFIYMLIYFQNDTFR